MVEFTRVKREDVVRFCIAVFEKLGVPRKDAQVVTEVLVLADLRNKDSHGVARLARYVEGLRSGLMLPTDHSKVVRETVTTALIDGERSLGQVVGKKGMELAIQKANANGTGFVTVRNSNHYGIAGYYALMAVDAGCIGISMTNAAPLVVPTFGRDALLGTNPISIAIPAEGEPFILDMATSVVPRGKLEVYDRLGKAMPVGWAVDEKGHVSQDPTRVLNNLKKRGGGGILPLGGEGEEFGGHKGYGLALAVEILCGTLSASAFGGQTYVNEQSANVGHFFGAIEVAAFRPLADMRRDLRRYLDSVQASPKAEGHDRIYVHGEKGFLYERRCLQEGIPIDAKTLASMKKIGGELGVPWFA